MTTIKLKFKIETLHKLLKFTNLDEINILTKTSEIRQKFKPSSAKQSGRSSKIINNEYDTLPGFENFTSKMDAEEKDDLMSFLKSYDFPSLSSIFTILHNKQFYNKIKSKIGMDIIRSSFKEIIKTKCENLYTDSNYNINSSTSITSNDFISVNDECELYYYFKDVINITEIDAIEIFDLFKYNEQFSFNEMNFVVLIFISAGYECGSLEDCMKIFSEDIFNFISGGEQIISLSRLKDAGRVLGFSENVLSLSSNECGLDMYSSIDVNKFKEFYMALAKKYDLNFKSSNTTSQCSTSGIVTGIIKKSQKSGGSGCMSKACNIL
jgi:hypothetical protein